MRNMSYFFIFTAFKINYMIFFHGLYNIFHFIVIYLQPLEAAIVDSGGNTVMKVRGNGCMAREFVAVLHV